MKRIFLLLLSLLLLNSCDSELKPTNFETAEIDLSFDAEITAIYDKAIGNNELSKTINFKIEEAIVATLIDVSKKTNLESILKDFNEEYLNFKNTTDDLDSVWELHIETEKTYQSKDIITIAISTYEYKGGAHGNDKIKFLNLDSKTGKVLNHKDLINNIEHFKSIAKLHFIKSFDEEEDNISIEDLFFGKPFHLPENIGFSDDGLILLYNIYEVASYDQGYTEFIIPFEDITELLNVH